MNKFDSVDEYIESFPESTQVILHKIRSLIKKNAPDASEQISYGMPGYKLSGKPLVYFGGFKNHIGFYPVPSGIAAFKTDLSSYTSGKGSVQFPLDQEIPYDLILKIVEYRVKEVLQK